MGVFTTFDTQRLTRVKLELVAGRGHWRRPLMALLIVALATAGAAVIMQAGAEPRDLLNLFTLRQENARLQGELQRAHLELDMERATRTDLERRNQELGEQVTELGKKVEFVNSRTQ